MSVSILDIVAEVLRHNGVLDVDTPPFFEIALKDKDSFYVRSPAEGDGKLYVVTLKECTYSPKNITPFRQFAHEIDADLED